MKKKTLILSLASLLLLIGAALVIIFVMGGFRKPMKETIIFKENITDVSFQNDLGITNIGDPFMLKISENEYYMYCTSAGDGFFCWRSEDMVNWTDKTKCYEKERLSWGLESFWAPEVVAYEGKYYMFYTAKSWTNTLRIGLAIADSPAGPFIDYQNRPLFDFGFACIDANVLIDDDGSKYMYFSRDCSENMIDGKNVSQSYGVQLADDMMSVIGEPVLLTTPEQAWELQSGDFLWNEGPEVIKHNGKYYLSYSANFYASNDYSLGYAVSDSPLGPFVKAEENPILSTKGLEDVAGTGHHSFTYSPDGSELWIAYHSQTNIKNPSGDRKVNIAKAGFTEDGKLYFNGPLTTMQPLPSGVNTTNVTSSFVATVNEESVSLLTDERVQVHKNQDLSANLVANKKGKVNVSLTSKESTAETPVSTNITALAIYVAPGKLKDIASVKICVNDTFCSGEYMITEESTSPIILSFEPISAEKMDVVITLKEGKESVDISEIEIFTAK